MHIRPERAADLEPIREVITRAFGQPDEARLVDALRAGGGELLSLVAEAEGRVVGHVLFTQAWIGSAKGRVEGMGLAPLAVLPAHQRAGVGSALTNAGLDILRERGAPFVVVLGHPEYYARFGFEPAAARGLSCPWPVPEGVFRALVFEERALAGVTGLVRYRPEFDELD